MHTIALTLIFSLVAFVSGKEALLRGASPENNVIPERNLEASIVDLATSTEKLTTLVELVVAADLVETLSGDGPFTVFAPSNKAFEKLPKGTLDSLGADAAALAEVLTYHVVPGKVLSKDLEVGLKATTVEGSTVKVKCLDPVKINDAKVIQADIMASNGVIHIIDEVLVPKDMAADSSSDE